MRSIILQHAMFCRSRPKNLPSALELVGVDLAASRRTRQALPRSASDGSSPTVVAGEGKHGDRVAAHDADLADDRGVVPSPWSRLLSGSLRHSCGFGHQRHGRRPGREDERAYRTPFGSPRPSSPGGWSRQVSARWDARLRRFPCDLRRQPCMPAMAAPGRAIIPTRHRRHRRARGEDHVRSGWHAVRMFRCVPGASEIAASG